ncbi:hypothetical protein RJ641_021754 [Dillenia turbinata]|uniref:Uncharacterized protein n=1 Tax=Dillenia turbinata TaxID=194707 RepID=A0AAN8YYQ6_9MAGN
MKKRTASSSTASKIGKKNVATSEPQGRKIRFQQIRRHPLNSIDCNTSSSSCSSTCSSSISIEAQKRGCLSFFSSVSRNPNNTKTPKSAPIAAPPNPTRSKPKPTNNGPSTSKPAPKSIKKRPISRLTSGCSQNQKQEQVSNPKEADSCPLCKSGAGSAAFHDDADNCASTTTSTPPVQSSLSPQIQCNSSTVPSKSPCYYAGYVVSGVADRRKCRARGILTVGDSGKTTRVFNDSRVSPVLFPTDASMRWLLSPCNGEDEEDQTPNSRHGAPGIQGKPRYASPLSSESDVILCKDGTSALTLSNTNTTTRRNFTSIQDDILVSWSYGVAAFSVSPCTQPIPNCKDIVSKEEREYRYHHYLAPESSPLSTVSLDSENVIQTPQSDSCSEYRHISTSWLCAGDFCLNEFNSKLDLVADVFPTISFSNENQKLTQNPTSLTAPSQLSKFSRQRTLDDQAPWILSSTSENVSLSQMRISWREGLASRIFELDEMDCCRCISDDDDDINVCNVEAEDKQDFSSGFRSLETIAHESRTSGERWEKFPHRSNSCSESISTDGGGLVASGDSNWTICYKNRLFEL